MRLIKVLAALLSIIWTIPAAAHNPGFSVAELQIGEDGLVARLRFAQRSMDAVLDIDIDRDGALSSAELESAHSQLSELVPDLLVIRSEGEYLAPRVVAIDIDRNDGLEFVLTFPKPASGRLEVSAPRIAAFARGYRQFVSVVDASGDKHTGMLSADRASLEANLRAADRSTGFPTYLAEGIWHIWIGFDHSLFLFALLLPAVLWRKGDRWRAVESFGPALRSITAIVTAFTIAHSLTLSIAVLGYVTPPSRWVESVIAVTVVIAALNNLCPIVRGKRWVLAFFLGLIHGFGFAGVLSELGLPADAAAVALAGFNIGVEIGQLAIVAAFLPFAYIMRRSRLYERTLLRAGSFAIISIALVWFVERSFEVDLIPVI